MRSEAGSPFALLAVPVLLCASCVLGDAATEPAPTGILAPRALALSDVDTVQTFGIGTIPLGRPVTFSVTHVPPWLTVDPETGTLGGGLVPVTAHAHVPATMDAGTTSDSIVFVAPDLPRALVYTSILVQTNLVGRIQPEQVALSAGDTATLVVSNEGHGQMNWRLRPNVPWLHVVDSTGAVLSGQSASVRMYADASQLASGSHQALVGFFWGVPTHVNFDRNVEVDLVVP